MNRDIFELRRCRGASVSVRSSSYTSVESVSERPCFRPYLTRPKQNFLFEAEKRKENVCHCDRLNSLSFQSQKAVSPPNYGIGVFLSVCPLLSLVRVRANLFPLLSLARWLLQLSGLLLTRVWSPFQSTPVSLRT